MVPQFDEKWSNIHPRGAKGRIFIDFIDFVPCRKVVVFSMAFWGVQKSKKSSLGPPKARKVAAILRQVGASRVGWPQGRPRARGLRIKRNDETRNKERI